MYVFWFCAFGVCFFLVSWRMVWHFCVHCICRRAGHIRLRCFLCGDLWKFQILRWDMRGERSQVRVKGERWEVSGERWDVRAFCDFIQFAFRGWPSRGLRKRFLAITRWVYYRNSVLVHERKQSGISWCMTLGTLCQAESFPVSWFWPVTKTPPHGQELKQLSGDILSLLLVPLLPLSPDCFVLSCAVSSPIVHVSWRTSRYSSISLETLACLEKRLLIWAFTSIACYFSLSGFAGWLSVVAFASIAFLLLCMAFVICYCFLRQCNVTNHISM